MEQGEPMPDVTMLELADGTVALIDSEDVARVTGFEWQLPPAGSRYAVGVHSGCRGTCETVFLHRLIADAGPDDIVFHRNRNTLDNRRENLLVMSRLRVPAQLPVEMSEVITAD